jgi:hypothetical protein
MLNFTVSKEPCGLENQWQVPYGTTRLKDQHYLGIGYRYAYIRKHKTH